MIRHGTDDLLYWAKHTLPLVPSLMVLWCGSGVEGIVGVSLAHPDPCGYLSGKALVFPLAQTHSTGLAEGKSTAQVIDIHHNKVAKSITTFCCATDFPVMWYNKEYNEYIMSVFSAFVPP